MVVTHLTMFRWKDSDKTDIKFSQCLLVFKTVTFPDTKASAQEDELLEIFS